MSPATIVTASSFLLIVFAGLAIPVRQRITRRRMGRLERAFPRQAPFQFAGLAVFSPFIVAIPPIRQFSLPVTVAVSLAGCACFVLSLHDIVFARSRGIYERGLVLNAGCFPYSSVVAWNRPDPYTLRLRSRFGLRGTFSSPDIDLVNLVADKAEKTGYPLP